MICMWSRERTGYLDDYKPEVSEIESSSLKSKYDMEIDKNRMCKSKKTILDGTQVLIQHAHYQWHQNGIIVFELSFVSGERPSR